MIYELWISETDILDAVETQCCNAVALICSGSPVQAMWHTRGIVRHGGTVALAKFAQDIGLAVANAYGLPTIPVFKLKDPRTDIYFNLLDKSIIIALEP